MIKLKHILLEGRSTNIDIQKVVELFNKNPHMREAFYKRPVLYRGKSYEDGNVDYQIVQPRKHERASANTQNFYTTIIDNSDKWNEYPKRSRSIICTGESDTAADYGEVYNVVPISKYSKIGICPVNDFWWSFQIGNLNRFNMMFAYFATMFLKSFNNYFSGLEKSNFELDEDFNKNTLRYFCNGMDELKRDMDDGLEEAKGMSDEELNKYGEDYGGRPDDLYIYVKELLDGEFGDIVDKFDDDVYVNVFNEWFKSDKDFIDILEEQFDPNDNGFEVESFYELTENIGDQEVWTNEDCLLIKVKKIDKIEKLVIKNSYQDYEV